MNLGRTLGDMRRLETGRVKGIRGAKPDEFRQLVAAGLRQDAEICVIQKDGRHVLVLDRETAGYILMDTEAAPEG